MRVKGAVLITLSCLLISCAELPVQSTRPFDLTGRYYLYDKSEWSFSGRMAFSDKNNSISAAIDWKHQGEQDQLELSGPFGQGRTLIQLFGDKVVVDYGNEQRKYFGNVDELVARHVGISIPVSALKYWVLGLVEPDIEYDMFENGFLQAGWRVNYQQMQTQNVGQVDMPKKIRVEQNEVKLKLIINEWDIQN